MSTITEKIDCFVRWFFNVSPTSMSIESRPSRRRPASTPRASRAASPKERREPRTARKAKPSQSNKRESP